jgi:hypothetical protein
MREAKVIPQEDRLAYLASAIPFSQFHLPSKRRHLPLPSHYQFSLTSAS